VKCKVIANFLVRRIKFTSTNFT